MRVAQISVVCLTGDRDTFNGDCFQVYVLLIRRVTLRDAGMYTCELNSPNVTRSFHELKIISDRLMAPVVASDHDDNDSDNDSDNVTRDSIDVWNY